MIEPIKDSLKDIVRGLAKDSAKVLVRVLVRVLVSVLVRDSVRDSVRDLVRSLINDINSPNYQVFLQKSIGNNSYVIEKQSNRIKLNSLYWVINFPYLKKCFQFIVHTSLFIIQENGNTKF